MLLLIILLFIIYLLSKSTRSVSDNDIKKLFRQTARWSAASEQDENPFIALLHANYGVGYLSALLDITKPSDIENVIGVDMSRFYSEILAIQDIAAKRMINVCPDYKPKNEWLSKLAVEYLKLIFKYIFTIL